VGTVTPAPAVAANSPGRSTAGRLVLVDELAARHCQELSLTDDRPRASARGVVHLGELVPGEVEIALGGRDAGVAEHHLDRPQIGATVTSGRSDPSRVWRLVPTGTSRLRWAIDGAGGA
jgi:hypothetical protein